MKAGNTRHANNTIFCEGLSLVSQVCKCNVTATALKKYDVDNHLTPLTSSGDSRHKRDTVIPTMKAIGIDTIVGNW